MISRIAAAVAVFALATSLAVAQPYPNQRVTLIVPFAAGGPTDVVGRVVGAGLEALWRQPLLIDNRPGAGGLLGVEVAGRAKPDGYTLLFSGNGIWTAKLFIKDVAHNADDFRVVAKLAGSQYVLVTTPQTGAKTLQELISVAKSKPGQIAYGTIPFTTYDLDYVVFMQKAGIEMQRVPYNSAAPIMTAVLRNEVQFYFAIQGSVAPMIAEGKMVPVAMLDTRRSPGFPNVPTARELGFDFQSGFGFGIVVHVKTPEEVVRKLGADIVTVLKDPAISGKLRGLNYDVPENPLTWPEEVRKDVALYVDVAAKLGLKPQ